ncbi:TonB-dependent siderophore receptor [Acanthopleuribacter pedis]|uniref:TonB-dependent siderophore receptor n=2 Tax=Acanthopleuribacter pedis TaxID=442870 RepID=A0A8J7U786_9BACT|nr:TonB-dependent siderophore receptor [Acanthopleuribacter pedis]MBO1322243.1 TonB-dependent siderophore receptor [Acanthopleuribacter pedis]
MSGDLGGDGAGDSAHPGLSQEGVGAMVGAASTVAAETSAIAQKEPASEGDTQVSDKKKKDKAPEASAEFEYVVVGKFLFADMIKALRTPTPIIDVPQSLSIMTAVQLEDQGFTSIGEIINYTPGVNTSQGEGHRDAIVFRGVRSTADFFIDGVRDDVQYYRPLYNLEQVEILRGPNALLFGRGGTGGILNRVTKKGQIGERFTGYQFGTDSFGELGGQIDHNFDGGDNWAFRINAFYESLENHRDFYDGDRIGFNPTVKFQISPETTLDLSYEYADHERFIDRGVPTGADGRPVEAFEDVVFGDRDLNTTELEAHLIRARLEHKFSDNLKGNFSAFHGDYDKLYQNFYASDFDQATNTVELDGYLDTTQRQNTILSGDLIGEFDSGSLHHTVLFGAEMIDTASDQDRYNSYFDTSAADVAAGVSGARTDQAWFAANRPILLTNGIGTLSDGRSTTNDFGVNLNDDTHVDLQVFSVYLQDEIKFSEKFNATIGARFDSFDIEVFDVKAGEMRTRKDEEISPRFGLVYKPKKSVSVYGSYSESFLPRSGEQYANINGDNNRLDPNTFTNIEAGLKWDLNSNLNLTTAVFEIEQESPVVSDADAGTLDVIETSVEGFEATLQGRLTERWFISAGYSFLDGEQANGTLRPRELPENMFSVWNNVNVTKAFSFGLGLTYQDESFINNSNSAVLPSYTRIDAAAYYNVASWRIQLNVENLTDALYFPNAHSTHQATVGAPLNARLSFKGRF